MSTLTENRPPTPPGAGGGRAGMSAARDAYGHFVLFFEGLTEHHGGAHAFVPRRSFDIRLVPR